MTPAAFAFFIPVLLLLFVTPFLCVYCMRKRRPAHPVVPAAKKPALRRAEARERLNLVTEITNITGDRNLSHTRPSDEKEGVAETRSVLDKEW